MASYKDIAEMSGLSVGTISNVIRGKGSVKQANKERVQRAIEELNYRVNYQARSLASEKSGIIGLVFSSPENPAESEMLLKFEDLAEKYDYQILWATARLSGKRERASCEDMLSRRVDGLFIFSQTTENRDYFKYLSDTEKTPIILVGRYFTDVKLPLVAVDNDYSARVLVDYLAEKGYREFAYLDVADEADVSPNRDRRNGVLRYSLERGIGCQVLQFPRGENYYGVGYDAFEQMLASGPMPKLVIPRDDVFSLGFYNACLRHGYRVPEDISILSFGRMYGDRITPKKLTTFDPCFSQVVEQSFDIFRRLDSIPADQRTVMSALEPAYKRFVKGRLIEGETVARTTG